MTFRSFKNYSSERFNNDIKSTPWSILETFEDPDDKLHTFNLLFNESLDRHVPSKTTRLRGRRNYYITDEIRDLMATRDGWKCKFKQIKYPLPWSSYKNYCRQVRWKIALLKRNLWKNKSKKIGTTPISCGKSFIVGSLKNLLRRVGKSTIQKISTLAEEFQCEAHDSSFILHLNSLFLTLM